MVNALEEYGHGIEEEKSSPGCGQPPDRDVAVPHLRPASYPADLTGIEGNISADPLFCDEIELCLEADSPCLAGNHPHGHDCATVGAREDCGNPTPVEEGSWGRLKVRFRP